MKCLVPAKNINFFVVTTHSFVNIESFAFDSAKISFLPASVEDRLIYRSIFGFGNCLRERLKETIFIVGRCILIVLVTVISFIKDCYVFFYYGLCCKN